MHINDRPEFESFISFTCPTCASLNQDVIGVPALSVDTEANEHGVAEQEQSYICGRCLQQFRLQVRNLGTRVVVKLPDFPSIAITASQAYWTAEADALGINVWEVPKDPYESFVTTIDDVLEVIQSPHAEFFGTTLPRMAFIQLFAALEAYLTDTLLAHVLQDDARLARVLAGVKELQAIKLTLLEILADPAIVLHTVAETIHKMSFHNLSKADAICELLPVSWTRS